MATPRTVACPRCQTPVTWSTASPFRPFCSERCKLMDLGAWATEKYSVPDDTPGGDTAAEDDGKTAGH